MLASRLRTFGVAAAIALGFLLATRQLGSNLYSGNAVHRAQVDAFLAGRLALSPSPDALAHDLAWTPSGVQQVWGLGVAMWQTPFELLARAVGQGPFPDRIALLVFLALAWFVLLRAFHRADEPWWIGAGSALVTGLLPALVAMVRGRMGVYEETALYAYAAALILLGALVGFARGPTRNRYLGLLLVAGVTGLLRPTVWFYGAATAALATAIYLRAHGRRMLPVVALGAALFVAGGATLYATNATRFGAGSEFGHRLNLESLPGNVYATRFSYPFERTGYVEAATELVGSLFGSPELGRKGFYAPDLHVGQSSTVRWREYYFTTFSWPYLALVLAGLALAIRAWRRRTDDRWLGAWAVIGAAPLAVFYLRSPSISSRYEIDLAPAIAALLVVTWRAAATWAHARGRGAIAAGVLVAAWLAAVLTGHARGRVASDLVDRDTATAARDRISRAPELPHELPPAYDLRDPKLESYLDADGKPPELYLNGTGWERPSGRVAPAVHLFVRDPQFLEVEVEPADAQVQVAIGRQHLVLASMQPIEGGARLRFAMEPMAGLQVAFLAFGPDTQLDLPQTKIVLRSVRWR